MRQGFQKLEHETETETQTHATENITMPHTRAVIMTYKHLTFCDSVTLAGAITQREG